jgi:uncharacterized protein
MEDQKKNMDRRTFLKTTGAGGASLAIGTGLAGNVLAAGTTKEISPKTVPTRILGKSGIPVSILSLGGIDWTTQQNLLRMGFSMGATLWDTSDRYENGKSEIGIGQYFSKYPEDRKKVFICTKASEKSEAKQVSDAIDTSLKNMNTDYLDLFLLTEIRNGLDNLPAGLKEMMEKKKKEGKIKLFGFSSHLGNDKIVTDAIALGWVDALMITYNYILMQKDEVKKQVDACEKAGIGLIAIKSQGKGPDMVDTPQALEATKSFMEKGYTLEQAKLKAIWSDERITSICSNINNVTILKDNVAAATDNVKLTSSDFRIFKLLAESESCNYCQGCGKCLMVMGEESRIPDVMRYMMYYNSYHERDRARNLYRELPGSVRNALATRDYSSAEFVCPHGLQVGKIMRKATSLLA